MEAVKKNQVENGEVSADAAASAAAPLAETGAGALPASVTKSAYPLAAAEPTQSAAEGIRFDFNGTLEIPDQHSLAL